MHFRPRAPCEPIANGTALRASAGAGRGTARNAPWHAQVLLMAFIPNYTAKTSILKTKKLWGVDPVKVRLHSIASFQKYLFARDGVGHSSNFVGGARVPVAAFNLPVELAVS